MKKVLSHKMKKKVNVNFVLIDNRVLILIELILSKSIITSILLHLGANYFNTKNHSKLIFTYSQLIHSFPLKILQWSVNCKYSHIERWDESVGGEKIAIFNAIIFPWVIGALYYIIVSEQHNFMIKKWWVIFGNILVHCVQLTTNT